ncbi:hypothetical protein AMAG_14797 [Allomyces macrogynus ATCC 38327]|uniref:Hint domain-containing protein n=1 Tax=Allomyces macrogynus (strain ATCC 38327) TaxID=578462 RepID=A0A0L0T602_ALLM3|nr:hypothetical protein AMAG_14797 [Allomyces macrogynus ATCC 38327]|eukprot:KNE69959.1 hypothetical protein AMAG_14797 [Allomyces macrogynus ATCC 38327]
MVILTRPVHPFSDVLFVGVIPRQRAGSISAAQAAVTWVWQDISAEWREALSRDFQSHRDQKPATDGRCEYSIHAWEVALQRGLPNARGICVESDKVTVIVYCKSTFWRYHHYSTPDVVARILIDSRRQNFSEDELAKSVHNMVNILAVQMGELTNNVQALSAQLESAFKWPVPVPMPESLIIPPDDFPSACGGTSASSRSKAPPKPEFRVDPAGIKAIRALAGGILFPVGVVGNLREGKSTLQNLILRAALPQTEGMAAQSEIFPTSNAYWSKTKGCSFVLVPHPSVQDGWILLFDFEGFGELTKDQSYCADYDARLAAIAFAFLRSLIYNTKSVLDTYLVDRLSTFKLAADIHLKKRGKAALQPHWPKMENGASDQVDDRVMLTMVLRDFALDAKINGEAAADHYYSLIKDGIAETLTGNSGDYKASPFALFGKMFQDIHVHTLPRPVSDASLLADISRLPTDQLDPDFQEQFHAMATNLFAHSPSLRVPLGTKSKQGDYLANLIENAVTVVNSGKSQALLMMSMTERVTARAVLAESEVQLDMAMAKIKRNLPCGTAELEQEINTACVRIDKALVEELENVGVTSTMVIANIKDLLAHATAQHRRTLMYANSLTATRRAERHRDLIMARIPDKKYFLYPMGDVSEFELWIIGTVEEFYGNLAGPEEIKLAFRDQLLSDLNRQLAVYRQFNATQLAHAEAQEKVRREIQERDLQAQEAMKKLDDAIKSGAGVEAAKAALQQQVDGYKEKLEKLAADYKTEISQLTEKHAAVMAETVAELKEAHCKALDNTRTELQAQIADITQSANHAKKRVDELQDEIDRHQCNNKGCFPGHAQVEVKGRGCVLMRDLVVGDIVRVHGERWELIVGWYDHNPSVMRAFLSLDFARPDGSRSSVTMTPNHLVFALTGNDGTAVACQAQHVRAGDKLWHAESRTTVGVLSIRKVACRGIYSPVPARSGTLIVDGVLASVYAKPTAFQTVDVADTVVHTISHWATYPLRTGWAFQLVLEKALGSALHHFAHSTGPSRGKALSRAKPTTPWLLPYLKLVVGSLVAVLSCVLG